MAWQQKLTEEQRRKIAQLQVQAVRVQVLAADSYDIFDNPTDARARCLGAAGREPRVDLGV
jgi:hypothetical protein